VVAWEVNATGRHVAVVAARDRAASAVSVGRETRAYIVGMAPVDLVPTRMSNVDLLAEVTRLAACERTATAALVALLAEVDVRRLHLLRCTGHHRDESERWFGEGSRPKAAEPRTRPGPS